MKQTSATSDRPIDGSPMKIVDQAARAHGSRLKKNQDLEMQAASFLSLKKIQF